MASEEKNDKVTSSATTGRTVIMRSRLEADSAHKAWYELVLISINEGYLVEKVSGAVGHANHSEIWFRSDFDEAEKKFKRIIADKTNPNRKSPRKYHVVNS